MGNINLKLRKTKRLRHLQAAGCVSIISWIVAQFSANGLAQSVEAVDQFNPSGSGSNNYASGQITDVWTNWFGGAFRSLVWDSANDAGANPASGSMEITANFDGSDGNSQWAVYDFIGALPPVNGVQYTNFECDVRFAPGSATTTNGGVALFGHLQFGVAVGWGQDWFGAVDIPASGTNWVHVSVPVNPASDPNLANIYNVILHIYGPYYTPLSGPSTCWLDNIEFSGAAPVNTNCVVNWSEVHQRIDGFGASSGFETNLTTAQADMFFSKPDGSATFLSVGITLILSSMLQCQDPKRDNGDCS
jgi:hypothetical protein